MRLLRLSIFPLLAFTVAVTACSSADQEPGSKKKVILGKLELSDGWARPGSKGQNSAVYLKIDNGTTSNDTLLAITSKVAKKAELHETTKDERGMMAMRPAGQQVINESDDLILKPGGMHIMLTDLKRDLAVGDSIGITVTFAQVGAKSLTVPVKLQE